MPDEALTGPDGFLKRILGGLGGRPRLEVAEEEVKEVWRVRGSTGKEVLWRITTLPGF